MTTRFAVSLAAILILALAACAGPKRLTTSEKASIARIAVTPAENPRWIHYYETGPSLPFAASAGAQGAQQKKFDRVFKSYTPDVAKPLTEAVIESLHAKGYTVVTGRTEKSDAVLALNLRAAGYGPAYDDRSFVPQFLLIVTITRTADQQSLYREVFSYGGGFSGMLTKLPHDEHFAFRTADEVLSQPKLVAQRLIEAARLFGSRVTGGLSK